MNKTENQKNCSTILKSSWILLGLIINKLKEKEINSDLISNVYEKISLCVSQEEKIQLLNFLKSFDYTTYISRGEKKIDQLNQLLTNNLKNQVANSEIQENKKASTQPNSLCCSTTTQNESEVIENIKRKVYLLYLIDRNMKLLQVISSALKFN
ncbi:hypothetical protein BNATCHR1105 (nucleomorph) [Bigelowiella natans]|uniref:Uncharacterized protein n=1 Tax=Bigelowiella natans TaxID=227086 RepID=Q3LWG4_BIGNA|nr:hypothetical protein BNATCHR1105 [Bigelowiella natans]ABA27201.1 hypothetical protein [Bigelowiella natans]